MRSFTVETSRGRFIAILTHRSQPNPQAVAAAKAAIIAAAGKGGQFAKGGGRVPAGAHATRLPNATVTHPHPPINPMTAKRAEIVKYMRDTGFKGSVSVSVPALRKMAAAHIAARHGGIAPAPPASPGRVPGVLRPRPTTPVPTPRATSTRVPKPRTGKDAIAPTPDVIRPTPTYTYEGSFASGRFSSEVNGVKVNFVDNGRRTTQVEADRMMHGLEMATRSRAVVPNHPSGSNSLRIEIHDSRSQRVSGYIKIQHDGTATNTIHVNRGVSRMSPPGSNWHPPASRTMQPLSYTVMHEYGHIADTHARADTGVPFAINRATASARTIGRYAHKNSAEEYAEGFSEWSGSNGQTTIPAVRAMAAREGWD